MAGLLKRVISRVFPKQVSETFELETVRPSALGYRLRASANLEDGLRPTTAVDEQGRFQVDGVTYKLNPASWEARQRIAGRASVRPGVGELMFAGEQDEERLLTLLAASPEIRVRTQADKLLRREELPLRVVVDFDPESGESTASLSSGGRPLSLPAEGAIGPVLEREGAWYRVTAAQRELLDRLGRLAPQADAEGRYRFGAASTPELIPHLRSRSDVDLSPSASEVHVVKQPLKPAVRLEEAIDQSLRVTPAWEGPKEGMLIDPVSLAPAGEHRYRDGSTFYCAPGETDATFDSLLQSGGGTQRVEPSDAPDFLVGSPKGPGSAVRRIWDGPAVHVDNTAPEIYLDVELDSGGLNREAVVEGPAARALYKPGGERPTGSWQRTDQTYFRVPSPEQQKDADEAHGRITGTDEIAEYLNALSSGGNERGRRPRVRPGPRARDARTDPYPATKVSSSVDIEPDEAGLRVRISYDGEAATIPHVALGRLPRNQKWFRDGDGFQKIDWRAFNQIEKAVEALGGEESDGAYKFPSYLFEEIVSRFGTLGLVEETELFGRWRQRVLDFEKIDRLELPVSLRSEWRPRIGASGEHLGIRPYQQKGYEWLCFLKKYGFGGILADEMGLGKTVQALLTVARYKEDKKRWCSLIITTKGAMSHWEKDARQFFDGLAVERWERLERSVAAAKPSRVEQKYDVLLVNYEKVLADVEYISKLRFRFIFFDEAQRMKNPSSKRRLAVCRLKAEARIAVTATPVETRLRDIWSIFDVTMKGKLGTEAEFVVKYEPQRNTKDLNDRVAPFVLRRTKSMPEIGSQLPGKSHRDRECEMEAQQRALYESIRSGGRKYVEELTKRKAAGNLHIFTLLTQLLQTCLHPSIVDRGSRDHKRSGKAIVALDLIEELLADSSNRILVFSRFVEAIKLLEEWTAPIASRVDSETRTFMGATSSVQRDLIVERFNDKTSRQRVMFISLQAGGVGLNLAAANHVIHFDRWWNPAVEWQAEDRAYRMNSERPVTVHRITTSDSIEERVAELIEQRTGLVRDIMDPQVAMEKLITRDELLRIFGIKA